MLTRLRLERFKSFEDAELSLEPFTLLVGANASGKSSVREALRFLHAAGRGYNLAEIFGGKWSGGERPWEGLRGGVREASFRRAESFAMEVEADEISNGQPGTARGAVVVTRYRAGVETIATRPPSMAEEALWAGARGEDLRAVYEASTQQQASQQTSVQRARHRGDRGPGARRP